LNEDEATGVQIVRRALEEPLRQIVENSGIEGSSLYNKVKEGKGDLVSMHALKQYENLIAAGVIDPTKVTRIALENAASIAGMLLTTECVISDKPEPKAAAGGAPHGGMPGGMGMDY
jgi:chaperonin GroEL